MLFTSIYISKIKVSIGEVSLKTKTHWLTRYNINIGILCHPQFEMELQKAETEKCTFHPDAEMCENSIFIREYFPLETNVTGGYSLQLPNLVRVLFL